jgi:MFS transporter, DHA1 family, inner membrane transport protein
LGVIGFSLVPPLVRNVISKAERAPTLASTANISAFNFGISLSVYLGGATINAGFGYTSPICVGAILAVIALIFSFISNINYSPKAE